MKLTLQLQLLPDAEQKRRLLETMERVNQAATFAARIGFDAGVFSQPSIHKLAYREIRTRFGLSAQMAVRAIGKAVECFRRDKKLCPVFRPQGAITYDERIMRFKGMDRVSLWALPESRVIVPLIYGKYQKERFDRIKGQADLVYRGRKFGSVLIWALSLLVAVHGVVFGAPGISRGVGERATEVCPVTRAKFIGVCYPASRINHSALENIFSFQKRERRVNLLPVLYHGPPQQGLAKSIREYNASNDVIDENVQWRGARISAAPSSANSFGKSLLWRKHHWFIYLNDLDYKVRNNRLRWSFSCVANANRDVDRLSCRKVSYHLRRGWIISCAGCRLKLHSQPRALILTHLIRDGKSSFLLFAQLSAQDGKLLGRVSAGFNRVLLLFFERRGQNPGLLRHLRKLPVNSDTSTDGCKKGCDGDSDAPSRDSYSLLLKRTEVVILDNTHYQWVFLVTDIILWLACVKVAGDILLECGWDRFLSKWHHRLFGAGFGENERVVIGWLAAIASIPFGLHGMFIVSQKIATNGALVYYNNYMANVLPIDKQIAVVSSLCEGSSIRSIERVTGVHRDTIMRLGVKVGHGCTALMDAKMRNLECSRLEMDEIWGYIGKKEKHVRQGDDPQLGNVWTFCAIDADSKLVPAFHVARERDAQAASAFVSNVAGRLKNRVQISTDGLQAYVAAIEDAFGKHNVDYGQIIKTYGTEESVEAQRRYSAPKITESQKKGVFGYPDWDFISTSYVERLNATTRLHMKRLARLTHAFSKKRENFEAAVGLHFAYYNFVRRHNTLRCTPAMAAGVEPSFWSVGDLVEACA